MKLINSKYEILEQNEGVTGIYQQIELAGRTCYKSEPKYRYWSEDRKRFLNKDTEDFKRFYSEKEYPIQENISAKDFVDRMIKSGHCAMLEHGTVYLLVEPDFANEDERLWELANNKYSEITFVSSTDLNYITTNYRVLVENDWLDLLKYQCNPTEYHKKRITVKFICDRGVSHEFVRHRVFSFAQESTRYCNYSKDKFNNQISICKPYYYDNLEIADQLAFINRMSEYESNYLNRINRGWSPEDAREFLPLCTATEVIYTYTVKEWRHIIDLRYYGTTGKPHPNAKIIAGLIRDQLIYLGYKFRD